MKLFNISPSGNHRAIVVVLIRVLVLALIWIPLYLASNYYKIPLFRLINGHYSEFGDLFFPLLTCLGDGLVLGIFLFFLWPGSAVHTLLGLESLIISGIGARILKHLIAAPRPPAILDQVHLVGIEFFKSSFPSGHTTSAFAVGLLFYSYFTHRAWKALAIILAVLVGYSRVYLGLHFPGDIVAGAGIGLLCTIIALSHETVLQGWLDALSGEHRKLLNRIMMVILTGGGVFLLLFYNQLPPTAIWFGNILGVSTILTGLFFLRRAPETA